jgi:hypothetical protein
MRIGLTISIVGLGFMATGVAAETVQLNHLDCSFNEETKSIVCPDVLTGRAAAVPVAASPVSTGNPDKGSAEWNAQCAAKYKSFDPATGMYTSFSGKTKPCR